MAIIIIIIIAWLKLGLIINLYTQRFDVVKRCWASKAEDRPIFSDISKVLSKNLEALTGYTALEPDERLGVCREPSINGDSLVKFQPEKEIFLNDDHCSLKDSFHETSSL